MKMNANKKYAQNEGTQYISRSTYY